MGLLFSILVFCQSALALEAKWLGVAGISISDGTTTLLFDPVATKPELKHWLFNAELHPDKALVAQKLQQWKITQAQGVFASHTHFDHASDVGAIAEKTGAKVYGGESLKRIATFQYPFVAFVPIKDRESFTIGDFKITPMKREHAPIIHAINWHFLEGEVPENFAGKFYDYHVGDTMGFLLEHPQGIILIDQGSHFFEKYREYAGKIKAYFLGVANKKSVEKLVEENIGILKPQVAIPLHFDYFMLNWKWLEGFRIPGMQLDELAQEVKNKYPYVRFHIPTEGEAIKI